MFQKQEKYFTENLKNFFPFWELMLPLIEECNWNLNLKNI